MSKKAISDAHIERDVCYVCYRPQSVCMCKHIIPIKTKTRFVILMHPKEFKKTKNGTGHFTNLSLENCELHVGLDFSTHSKINAILADPNNACYVIYPSESSIDLNHTSIARPAKNTVLFLIDATWPCSKSMLVKSTNLEALPKVSFTHTKSSLFTFKQQPKEYCLSTIESTLCVLTLLSVQDDEQISQHSLQHFLNPFKEMVSYQLKCCYK